MIRDDEQIHLQTLQSVATSLGGSTSDLDTCQFKFEAALSDVTTFLGTARVLEFVGVDACVYTLTPVPEGRLMIDISEELL